MAEQLFSQMFGGGMGGGGMPGMGGMGGGGGGGGGGRGGGGMGGGGMPGGMPGGLGGLFNMFAGGGMPMDVDGMMGGMGGGGGGGCGRGRGGPPAAAAAAAHEAPLELPLEDLYRGVTKRLRITRQVVDGASGRSMPVRWLSFAAPAAPSSAPPSRRSSHPQPVSNPRRALPNSSKTPRRSRRR